MPTGGLENQDEAYTKNYAQTASRTSQKLTPLAIVIGRNLLVYKNVQRVLEDGLKAAKKHGLIVSCDLNYRAKLWRPQEANRV